METLLKMALNISSPAFSHGEDIPPKYTCDGQNVNPALRVEGLPEQSKTMALILEDPDAPGGTFDHWLVWNIPVSGEIKENSVPGIEGRNGFEELYYRGPCPPGGVHRYYFKIFALNRALTLNKGASKNDLLNAMEGHVLATGSLMGRYKRNR